MAMESVLKCLIRDSQALGKGNMHIQQLAQVALESLESQTGLLQNPPYDLREKTLTALNVAVLSNSGHLLRLGLTGVQKLLRDNHFVSTHCDPPDDSKWLISQLLCCLRFPNWTRVTEEVQIEICKVFINFACLDVKYLNLNAHVITDFLTRCLDMGLAGGNKTRKLHLSIQTSSVQVLKAFASYISIGHCHINQAVPVLQFLCDKLQDGLITQQSFPVEFCLESILSLLAHLPDQISRSSRYRSFVWRTLCPTLLEFVGVPVPNCPELHKIAEFRCVASISGELLRLFGNAAVLRAPLESLFHRLAVVDAPTARIELFRCVKDVFSSSQRLLVVGGPFLVDEPDESVPVPPSEFGILRILFDAMEEGAKSDEPELRRLVLECSNKILDSLLALTGCPGPQQMPDPFVTKINLLHLDLESCDYIGALSYPSRLRMPKTYEQLVREQQNITGRVTLTVPSLVDDAAVGDDEDAEDDRHSCTSGVTEGPEADAVVEEDDDPELESTDAEPDVDISLFQNYRDISARSDHVVLERKAAKNFLQDLQAFLRTLNFFRSPLEVDMAIQEFASEYCQNTSQAHVIFNADGIYLAAYVTLLLNFELHKKGYYSSAAGIVTQSEEEFIESVLNSGILVYLTPEFLAELYQGVLGCDVMTNAGINVNASDTSSVFSSCSIVNLLTDVRQVKPTEPASCFLSDCRKLHFAFTPNFLLHEPRRVAGLKFSRRLLTCFWDSLLFVYSNAISTGSAKFQSEDHQIVSLALQGLENCAKLANILGLQDRSGTIFALLASVACGNPRLDRSVVSGTRRQFKNRLIRARLAALLVSRPAVDIDLPHILSLDVILNKGLELASYNKEAWSHILRCCLYVTELERRIYQNQSQQMERFRRFSAIKAYTSRLKSKLTAAHQQPESNNDLNLSLTTFGGLEEDSGNDSYSFLTAASQLPANGNDIQQMLKEAAKNDGTNTTGTLDDKLIARIVSLLSDRVELLLEDAASKLNLKSLLLLIDELCHLCHMQLQRLDEESIGIQCQWVLHRIGEVMLRSVKTGRPLFHALHCWAVVGPTLLKAACSNDPAIAKSSVEILRSVISHVLQEQPEPRHFHFNEALFKPYENLLCLDMCCDADLQDQVVSSLCELVECWSSEIRSGWRPLFACLRRWPPSTSGDQPASAAEAHLATVRGILAAFVQHAQTNALVFANAAMDAILCLIHYLKCYRSMVQLSLMALDYLQECSKILAKMCQTTPPVFYSAMRLTFVPSDSEFVANLPQRPNDPDLAAARSWAALFRPDDAGKLDNSTTLRLWGNPSGIYKVFYLLVDGITCTLIHSKDEVQKATCQVVMATLSLLLDVQECGFASLCLRCCVLPALSNWLSLLRSSAVIDTTGLVNFKQGCGLLCEIVTQLMNPAVALDPLDKLTVFRQSVGLYLQCSVECGVESLVRIGNSCLRHLILNSSHHFGSIGPASWAAASGALHLTIRSNLVLIESHLSGVTATLSTDVHGQLYRLQHLCQQIFNQASVNPVPQSGTLAVVVALLSHQLAVNTIANIIRCTNNVVHGYETILNRALFTENMQACAPIPGGNLEPLVEALRSCAEFGIDFQSAGGLRKELQRACGFVELPSLIPITRLCSDLLIVALCNLIVASDNSDSDHVDQLEQWIEFLVDFYFQETGQCGIKSVNRLVLHLAESAPSTVPDSPVTDASPELENNTPVNGTDDVPVGPESCTIDVTPLVIHESDVPGLEVARDISDSAVIADTSIPVDPVDTNADVAVQPDVGNSLGVPELSSSAKFFVKLTNGIPETFDCTVDVTPLVIHESDVPETVRNRSDSIVLADTSIPTDPVDTDADVPVKLDAEDFPIASICTDDVTLSVIYESDVPETFRNLSDTIVVADTSIPINPGDTDADLQCSVEQVVYAPAGLTNGVPESSYAADSAATVDGLVTSDPTLPDGANEAPDWADCSPLSSRRSAASLETSEDDDDDDPELNARMAAVLEAYQTKMKLRTSTQRIFPKTSSPFKVPQVSTASLSRDLLASALELLSRVDECHLSGTLAGLVRILTRRMERIGGSVVHDQQLRHIYARIRDKMQSAK